MSNARYGLRTLTLGEVRTLARRNVLQFVEGYFSDLFGVPDFAFSLRKVTPNSVYSGAAFRVRRSSDNTEQDIDFITSLADSTIDTTDLLNFVGAGNNGFVTKWYDQSGNARHVENSTAADQPQIVFTGSVNVVNSLPAIHFSTSGKNRRLTTTSNYSTPTSLSFITALKYLSNPNNSYNSLWNIGTGGGSSGTNFALEASGAFSDWQDKDIQFLGDGFNSGRNPRFISSGQAFFTNNEYIAFGTLGSAASSVDINNNSVSARQSGTGNVGSVTQPFILGSDPNSNQISAEILELIFYGSNKSSDKTTMTGNLDNYYGIL